MSIQSGLCAQSAGLQNPCAVVGSDLKSLRLKFVDLNIQELERHPGYDTANYIGRSPKHISRMSAGFMTKPSPISQLSADLSALFHLSK